MICKLRIQTSYKQKQERQQPHNRNTTQDRAYGKMTNNKQQTTKHVITYKQTTKTKLNIRTNKNNEQRTVQHEHSINTTKRRMIRTTWLLFAT